MEYQRDFAREDIFNNAYKLKPIIHIKYEINPDNTFKSFTLKFGYKDKEWILEEIYNGNTNLTLYCTLTGIEEIFKRFVDAELKLVELLKNNRG